MAKYVIAGQSIECSRSFVAVRKVIGPTYLKIGGLDGVERPMFKYKTKKRAIVTVSAELNPKVQIFCETSYLELNDAIEGDVVEIYTDEEVEFELVSNFSHVHGIQGNALNNLTYARIALPFRFVLERCLGN